MPLQNILEVIVIVATICGFVGYVGCMILDKTAPKLTTWIIWAVLDAVLFAGMYVKNSLNPQMIITVPGVWAVTMVLIIISRKKKWEWNKIDKYCCLGAVLSIIGWAISGDPVIGIIFILLTNAIGLIPTIKSVWDDPSSESWLAWLPGFIAPALSIPYLLMEDPPKNSLADLSQPVSFAAMSGLIIFLIFFKTKLMKKEEGALKKTVILSVVMILLFMAGNSVHATGNPTYYLDQKVTLTGTLTTKKYYGPPNYGENPKTDSVEMAYVIILDNPIDVLPSDSSKEECDCKPQYGMKLMMVYTLDDKIRTKKFKKRKVRLTGVLVPATTGHHHTEVMVEFTTISLASKKK